MPRKAQKKYGPGGQYYRKRIKTPEGKYEDVYGKTLTELSEKVTLRKNQLAAASDVPPQKLFVFEYCAGFYSRQAPHLSADRQTLYQRQINKERKSVGHTIYPTACHFSVSAEKLECFG